MSALKWAASVVFAVIILCIAGSMITAMVVLSGGLALILSAFALVCVVTAIIRSWLDEPKVDN